MFSRRKIIHMSWLSWLSTSSLATVPNRAESPLSTKKQHGVPLRCINITNFMRGDEPRMEMDLMLPVEKQMELINKHNFPATWLMQYDALVRGPWAPFLKANKLKSHEVGFWFEMNELLCKAAGVEWRGRPHYEWDSRPSVAFTIGYSPEERILLADQAVKGFQDIWGFTPKSVASWNLDSHTINHLVNEHKVEAFAVCRDQIATDGFTIWGAPIAGYYPSKNNCWSPAVHKKNQIDAPILRMLGQDPIHYYEIEYTLPNGQVLNQPDTMEPVWASGQDPTFIEDFFELIAKNPCGEFAYLQMGQENNFGWPAMEKGFEMQMDALAILHKQGTVHLETMSQTGKRFKNAFAETPVQMQIQLKDPFPTTAGEEQTCWYQSRHYRANLNINDGVPYFRDITVYSDHFTQPFLNQATTSDEVDQQMLAVLDGYHWRGGPVPAGIPTAGGFFYSGNNLLKCGRDVKVTSTSSELFVRLPMNSGKEITIEFKEDQILIRNSHQQGKEFSVEFLWDQSLSDFKKIEESLVIYEFQGFTYSVWVESGQAEATASGWKLTSQNHAIRLVLNQG